MRKYPYIPNTWGISDDQAKKIGEALNQKSPSSPVVELMNTLKQTATKIADQEPEPDDWADWIFYLFEQLQAEAEKDFKAKNLEAMLVTLRDRLNIRINKGKW